MTKHDDSIPIFGIVPAAGFGRRMGHPKQSLPFRGTTIAGQVARSVLDAEVDGLTVVTRRELVPALDLPTDPRLRVAFNDAANAEMIDSIRVGLSTWFGGETTSSDRATDRSNDLRRADEGAGVLIVPGDMPGMSADVCRLCMSAFRAEPACLVIATCRGRRGHPLIFPASLCGEVSALNGGLHLLAERHLRRVRLVETSDPAVHADIDTWEDYKPFRGE